MAAGDCLTPGAVYSMGFHGDTFSLRVEMPPGVIDAAKAAAIDGDVHDAIERIFARFFDSEQAAAEAAGPEPDFPERTPEQVEADDLARARAHEDAQLGGQF